MLDLRMSFTVIIPKGACYSFFFFCLLNVERGLICNACYSEFSLNERLLSEVYFLLIQSFDINNDIFIKMEK